MTQQTIDITDFHWLIGMLNSIDVGLIVLDKEFNIQVWNRFMASHSGMESSVVHERNLFEVFPDLDKDWFSHKIESVFLLNNQSFTIHEQRPYLFKFKNNRPITGTAEFMYQNATLIPLTDSRGRVSHVGIAIYDVSDQAVNKSALHSAINELTRISRTDKLTDLYNRGYWEECLAQEFLRYQRTAQTSSLVMFDIDHFKKINDTYGHQAGDDVIRYVAGALKQSIRTSDIVGRYGGEEFGCILIDTDQDGAIIFAERLRKTIENTEVPYEGEAIQFTISLGISTLNKDIKKYTDWLELSDKALYAAKHAGRNQVKF
jgi:diguanylate cyclase (GGDEF)-like protein